MVDLKQLQASLPKVPGAGGLTQEEQIELDWAAKAHHHGEAHMKIISAFDPATLNFTSYDDDIYRQYSRCFKGLKIDIINPDDLKSDEARILWKPFCEMFRDRIPHYNFGTLLRLNCNKGYTEENTIFVTKIEFYAIEIARNRQHLNKFHLRKDEQKKDATPENEEKKVKDSN